MPGQNVEDTREQIEHHEDAQELRDDLRNLREAISAPMPKPATSLESVKASLKEYITDHTADGTDTVDGVVVEAMLESIRAREKSTRFATVEQPPSIPNNSTPIYEKVIEDIRARVAVGVERYGTPLQANNGRDPRVDLYQELLDATMYVRQMLDEHDKLKQTASDMITQILYLEAERDTLRLRHNAAITEVAALRDRLYRIGETP